MIKNTLSVLTAIGLGLVALTAGPAAAEQSCPALNRLDPDGDGSFSIFEAKRRANAVFDKLNNDGDRTLEADETRGRVSAGALAAANPDGDGSLDRWEWRRLLRARFNAANTDGDWSIECDELATHQGRILYHMIK